MEVRWVGFDLDDTPHDYRGASRAAKEAVFAEVKRQAAVTDDALNVAFTRALKNTSGDAFTSGHDSKFYRTRRFAMMLGSIGVDDKELLTRLVALYGHVISRNLRCFDGVPNLLSEIRSLGISLCVITEGPRDAQEETIARLGLTDLLDLLVTSNDVGVEKTDGLFAVALKRMGCDPDRFVIVGDSIERDLRPALATGIKAYLIDHRGLHKDATTPRLDNLCDLLDLLKAPHKE